MANGMHLVCVCECVCVLCAVHECWRLNVIQWPHDGYRGTLVIGDEGVCSTSVCTQLQCCRFADNSSANIRLNRIAWHYGMWDTIIQDKRLLFMPCAEVWARMHWKRVCSSCSYSHSHRISEWNRKSIPRTGSHRPSGNETTSITLAPNWRD